MRKAIAAALIGAAISASPASAAVLGYQLTITGNNTDSTADTPKFLLTNTSSYTGAVNGADALSAYLTSFRLTFDSTSYIDRLTNFTRPTPPAQTAPAIGYTVVYPDTSSNNKGAQGFLIDFTGFNAGDAFQFNTDFDLANGRDANYRSILEGSTIDLTFADGTTQSLTLQGFNADQSTYVFSGTNPGAVPEPASWAMFIGGFGLIGGAVRRQRKPAVTFA